MADTGRKRRRESVSKADIAAVGNDRSEGSTIKELDVFQDLLFVLSESDRFAR